MLPAQELPGGPAEPTILERSPFIPPDFTPPGGARAAAAAKASAGGYEFRGVYQIGGEYRFLVSEPRSRKGSWVKLGKAYDGYEVRNFDPTSDTLTLFFNNSEQQLQLAELDANPTPMPVSGQIKTAQRETQAPTTPPRRAIRPATRPTTTSATQSGSTPPPAWLKKLREEAATRRTQAMQGRGGGTDTSVKPSGEPGYSPPPPPDSPPPTPPPNLSEIDIPPPPTELPPPPPPEVMDRIQQTISAGPPRG